MSDLISRQMVMDYLREQQAQVIMEKARKKAVTYEACKGMEASIEAFMNFINQIPAAYDVDEVMRRLEREIELKVTQYPLHGRYIKKSRAIEIVKAGGADE